MKIIYPGIHGAAPALKFGLSVMIDTLVYSYIATISTITKGGDVAAKKANRFILKVPAQVPIIE